MWGGTPGSGLECLGSFSESVVWNTGNSGPIYVPFGGVHFKAEGSMVLLLPRLVSLAFQSSIRSWRITVFIIKLLVIPQVMALVNYWSNGVCVCMCLPVSLKRDACPSSTWASGETAECWRYPLGWPLSPDWSLGWKIRIRFRTSDTTWWEDDNLTVLSFD